MCIMWFYLWKPVSCDHWISCDLPLLNIMWLTVTEYHVTYLWKPVSCDCWISCDLPLEACIMWLLKPLATSPVIMSGCNVKWLFLARRFKASIRRPLDYKYIEPILRCKIHTEELCYLFTKKMDKLNKN